MSLNAGFISTRFSGLDGVSLESAKWAQILWDHRCVSYWFAGKLDRARNVSSLASEAAFDYPLLQKINRDVFGKRTRAYESTKLIHEIRARLKSRIAKFIERFSMIAGPLHDFTKKKDKIQWRNEDERAFQTLKIKLLCESLLKLLDLSKSFEVHCDTYNDSLGVVLLQDGHPIAYES